MSNEHKKPELNILHRIVMWNKDRGLLEKDFNLKKESAYILEEIFEAFGFPDTTETKSQVELLGVYDPSIHSEKYPRTLAKQMTSRIMIYYLGSDFVTRFSSDIADAFGDIIVFATGAIAKLGYDPVKIVSKIMDANDAKGSATDAEGKIMKDKSFVEPEAGFDDCLLPEEFKN